MSRNGSCARTLTLTAALVFGPSATVIAQSAPAVAQSMTKACQGRATCSESDFYSGKLTWHEKLTADLGGGSGDSSTSRRTVSIDIVITSGAVQCQGTVTEEAKAWSSGQLTINETMKGVIAGPGIFKITFDKGGSHTVGDQDVDLNDNTPSYDVAVVCPAPEETHTSGSNTRVTPAEPAEWGSSYELHTYSWPGSFTTPALIGKSSYRHPDADPVNGVTGSVDVSWSLTKNATPTPKP